MEGARALENASKTPVVAKTERTRVGTLQAARTVIEAEGKVTIDLMWIAHAGRIFQIAGIAQSRRYEAVRPLFKTAKQSFRPLSSDERSAIREQRIRLIKARSGETVDALTARSNSSWSTAQVAAANSLIGTERLEEGRIIKVAVAEPYVVTKEYMSASHTNCCLWPF